MSARAMAWLPHMERASAAAADACCMLCGRNDKTRAYAVMMMMIKFSAEGFEGEEEKVCFGQCLHAYMHICAGVMLCGGSGRCAAPT